MRIRPTAFRSLGAAVIAAVFLAALGISHGPARAQEPIKIGFGMALTGGLGGNGKAALLAMKIWEEEINAKGGLLGRPVKLIYYDDQSNPATVPGIYTKLLDVDKVDLVIGDYGTNLLAPAMPVVIAAQDDVLRAVRPRREQRVPIPELLRRCIAGGAGPEAVSFSKGFFEIAVAQNPKPKTVAIIAADAEFPRNAADGARENAKEAGLQDRLRQDLSADHDRLHPDRAGDRRRPTPTSCSSAPIRPTRSAWCAPSTRSASSRRCSAAAWSACSTPRSSSSSGRCSTASSTTISGSRCRRWSSPASRSS